MPKLTIDGKTIEVADGTSVMQACEQLGIEIPHFCYHDKLSVAASCRMCLVEIEKMPKPVPSCAQPCAEGMVVHTDTPAVRKARRAAMELLLINHPLDCPICDQGGECDLQDQAVAYGVSMGRMREPKRAVAEKDFGPLIKTAMTRCIHCTRCVRFVDEICGTPELGGMFRGENLEIGTYVERALTSELSGNLIDLCPVGALTNKPHAFQNRAWEYKKTESVDVLDAVGSNIRIDTCGNEVMRVVPQRNEDVNEDWISDKTRFAIDGLTVQRLDRPYIRKNGKLEPASWDEALALVAEKMHACSPSHVAALAGDLVDCETMFAMKTLLQFIGSPNMDCRQDGASYDVSSRSSYIMNTTIKRLEEADAVLLVGTNPRHEAPMVNARLRKRWLRGGCRIGLVGDPVDLGYPYKHLGDTPDALLSLARDEGDFSAVLKNATKPAFLVGSGALARSDGNAILNVVKMLAEYFNAVREDWNGFNVLQRVASRVGGLDLGFIPQRKGFGTQAVLNGAAEFVWLLGVDELDFKKIGGAFVVYQGHHGDKGAQRADVILPGAAYTEKSATYVNTEGRPQHAWRATFPPGDAREDWKIIHAVADAYGVPLPFKTLEALREKMAEAVPLLATSDSVEKAPWVGAGSIVGVVNVPFTSVIDNFYMTDPISRASATMAKCTRDILPLLKKEGTA
ncbi:MAG: NADH-quinone oxidoreductase subunit NuoG [Alphaproteobacteria bacterium]|nr:NADH-quinone oxidoreductase subunit NuoG [Alphaproteobacteria bacterium]